MTRIARDPRGARLRRPAGHRRSGVAHRAGRADPQRGDLARPGLGHRGVARRASTAPRGSGSIGVAGVVAAAGLRAVGLIRDWVVFGSPLPGQAATNALSVTGFDIFAWNDPPTLARYLAVGPARLRRDAGRGPRPQPVHASCSCRACRSRSSACSALPWQGRGAALRPVAPASAVITFLVTSLVFPVATTWGTFLHAAGPVHVLLIVLGAARPRRRDRPARRAGWAGRGRSPGSGALLGDLRVGALLGRAAARPSAAGRATTAAHYEELGRRMAAAGHPLDATAGPVITDFPIWLAESQRIPALALPDEPPADVLDLAHDPAFPGTHLLVVAGGSHGQWPAVLDSARRGRGLLPRDRPRRPDRPAGPTRSRTPARSRSSVHERRPVYSEVRWRQHAPRPHAGGEPLRRSPRGGDGGGRRTARTRSAAIRERYREAYDEALGPLAGPARRARAARGRAQRRAVADRCAMRPRAASIADDAARRRHRRAADQGPAPATSTASPWELGDHQAELASSSSPCAPSSGRWLFLERGDATLLAEADGPPTAARRPDADRRGPGGRALAARPGDPRRAGPGPHATRSSRSSTSSGSSTRTRGSPRTELRLPARAAPPRARRRPRVHQPAPAAAARRARPGRRDRRRRRARAGR